jgi:hypothetical protein
MVISFRLSRLSSCHSLKTGCAAHVRNPFFKPLVMTLCEDY